MLHEDVIQKVPHSFQVNLHLKAFYNVPNESHQISSLRYFPRVCSFFSFVFSSLEPKMHSSPWNHPVFTQETYFKSFSSFYLDMLAACALVFIITSQGSFVYTQTQHLMQSLPKPPSSPSSARSVSGSLSSLPLSSPLEYCSLIFTGHSFLRAF